MPGVGVPVTASVPGGDTRTRLAEALHESNLPGVGHLGVIASHALAAALLPIVESIAAERAAEELVTRAAQITARASEEEDEQVVAALDDEAARLHARAAALRAASRGEAE